MNKHQRISEDCEVDLDQHTEIQEIEEYPTINKYEKSIQTDAQPQKKGNSRNILLAQQARRQNIANRLNAKNYPTQAQLKPITKVIAKQLPKQEPIRITSHTQYDIKKDKERTWDRRNQIIQLESPLALTEQQSRQKKYKITFKYKTHDGSVHQATVRFGKRHQIDKVDQEFGHNGERLQTNIRQIGTPFHQNYWSFHLLNHPMWDNIQTAHAEYRKINKLL